MYKTAKYMALGLIVILSGCGTTKETKSTPQNIILKFDTNGKYDVSEYLFPQTSQIATYKRVVYVNAQGKKSYSQKDATESFYAKKHIVSGKYIAEYVDNVAVKKYVVNETKIHETVIETKREKEIVRHADRGEHIMNYIYTHTEAKNTKQENTWCRIDRSLDERGEHKDLLVLSCNIHNSIEVDLDGSQTRKELEGTYIAYLAKGKGIVESLEETCIKVNIDDVLGKDECRKTEETLLVSTPL